MARPTTLLVTAVMIAGGYFTVPHAPRVIDEYKAHRKKTDTRQVAEDLCRLREVCDRYVTDTGIYPRDWVDLWVRSPRAKGWDGPYLTEDERPPLDPWGNPYRVKVQQMGDLQLVCWGADGRQGGRGEAGDMSDFQAKLLR